MSNKVEIPETLQIDLTPTWEGLCYEWRRLAPYQTVEGHRLMWNELTRVAQFTDKWNKLFKERGTIDGLHRLVGELWPDAEIEEQSDGNIQIVLNAHETEENVITPYSEEEHGSSSSSD